MAKIVLLRDLRDDRVNAAALVSDAFSMLDEAKINTTAERYGQRVTITPVVDLSAGGLAEIHQWIHKVNGEE